MKLLYRIFTFISIIFLIIISILCINILNSNATQVEKTNVIIQGIYAFVTTILVILTFSVLIVSKKQNYQSVKPDLTLGQIDLIDDHRNELDYEILNVGKDKAFNILIKLFKGNEKLAFYEKLYPRLHTTSSDLKYPLYQIVNAIREFKRETTKNSNGIGNYIVEETSIYEEIQLPTHFSEYYDIRITIQFEDIYANQYLNTFILSYDEEEGEYGLVKETFKENENIISEIKKLFK